MSGMIGMARVGGPEWPPAILGAAAATLIDHANPTRGQFRVPRGSVEAKSVVTTLPRITAPASRSAATLAASRPVRQPTNSGEPCSVGISAVSMMSLTPSGIPSIGDSGWPARQRSADRSAAARAAAMSWQTKAPTAGRILRYGRDSVRGGRAACPCRPRNRLWRRRTRWAAVWSWWCSGSPSMIAHARTTPAVGPGQPWLMTTLPKWARLSKWR